MPGTHSPISRHFFTLDGNVRTAGGAKNLAKGEFTIVESAKATANGALVVTDFAGKPDSTVYEMRLGKHKIPETRSAYNSKPDASHTFKIKDVVEVKANFPKVTKQTFDELLIGYDGINADTAITLEEGMTTPLDITLSGDHIMYRTGEEQHVIEIHLSKEVGETDQEVVERAVKNLKSQTLPGDIPVEEFIKIDIIDSTATAAQGEPYVFSNLNVTDQGDTNALARIQYQYPDYEVKLTARNGLVSVYTILHPADEALSNYSQITSNVYIKDCEDCIAGYTEIDGGFVYSVTLEDDGTDQTALVDDLPGFVTGSVIRHGVKNGRGLYTVVVDDELTEAEIAAYVATAGVKTTATIELLGEVSAVCSDVDTVSIAWVDGDTCYAQTQTYYIQLKDNDCGESRLGELQAYYPDLTIEEGLASGDATQAVTLTGTSGTANVNVAGTNYLATFNTNLTTTASDFVTAHAAAILAATGLVVTADAGVLTFAGEADSFPVISIANVSGDLAGTVAAIDYDVDATAGGCQRVYSTQVVTNIVCDECSPYFTEMFTSEAPQDFDFTSWVLLEPAASEDALMGIKLTGKPFIFYPTHDTRDMVPFYETSTRIMASGGYVEEENESFEPIYRDIFNVKRLSRAQDRDNLGAHLMQWEDASRAYFNGTMRHKDNLFAQQVLGEESVLEFNKQYVQTSVTVLDTKFSQSAGGRSDMGITYSVWAELGKHENLVSYINKLAARAGVEAIQPIAVDFS